jgi:hypothetical protein
MTAPTFNGCFPHNWTAEILPNRPMILPSRHYVYPAIVEEVERGALEVLVQPGSPEALPFLATCALGFRDPAAPTGLWSCPNPDWLCAVSGGYAYLIDTIHPENFTMLRYRPLLDVLCYLPDFLDNLPDNLHKMRDEIPILRNGLLLFVGHHSILAWGREGEAWESERLSWEGITNLRIESGTAGTILHGEGWDLMTDKTLPFALELQTGKRIYFSPNNSARI